MTIFNKTHDGYFIIPQPHFNTIYHALHIIKMQRDSDEFRKLCEEYPQLQEIPVKGKVAVSFKKLNS